MLSTILLCVFLCQVTAENENGEKIEGGRITVTVDGAKIVITPKTEGGGGGTPVDRLTMGDIVYEGSFKLPRLAPNQLASRWGYGGNLLAYRPGNPGSLFSMGHSHQGMVAEFSIPAPVKPSRLPTMGDWDDSRQVGGELSEATMVQPFVDITAGIMKSESDKVPGRFVLNGVGYLGNRIYWTLEKWYNVAGVDNKSHGFSNADFSNLRSRGPWHIGPAKGTEGYTPVWHSQKSGGYVTDIPEDWSEEHVGGMRLASGASIEQGAANTSWGPALYAFDLDAPEDAVALISYSKKNPLEGWQHCDRYGGVVWIDEPKRGVLYVGSLSIGETRYGNDMEPTDCSKNRGYHCDPYESVFTFYDPRDLEKVADGDLAPHEVQPYETAVPDDSIWPTCRADLTGIAYDRTKRLIYIIQPNAWKRGRHEPEPLVHVFRVKS